MKKILILLFLLLPLFRCGVDFLANHVDDQKEAVEEFEDGGDE